jgi:hypothetical protein
MKKPAQAPEKKQENPENLTAAVKFSQSARKDQRLQN